MHSQELEDLTLLLIRDAHENEMWLDRWAVSYPTVRVAEMHRSQSIMDWQHAVQLVWHSIHSQHIAVVAHGVGVSAWLAWLYQADVHAQKRVRQMMLVSPMISCFPNDAYHTLQRVRCHCPTALVIGRDDAECPREWAQQQARLWQAKLLVSPHTGHLNESLSGWQWGMKLLQEMLLD